MVSEGFGDEKNENNPISLTFNGFNTNILYLTSENPYEIDRKLNLGIIKNLHNRAKQENDKFISIKAFSIFYDENEKNEFYYDFFSKKGNKYFYLYLKNIFLEKKDSLKELTEITVEDFKQTQNLLSKITENNKFKEKNNFFVLNFKISTDSHKISDLNLIFIPFHYVLVQVIYLFL